MRWNNLQLFIRDWAQERDLLAPSNAKSQMLKVVEEVGELAGCLSKQKGEDELLDALGDSFVTLIILCYQLGYEPDEALEKAWKEIASRTGKTVDGVFIRNQSSK